MKRRKLLGIVALLSVLLAVPLVFSSNILNTIKMQLSSGGVTPSSSPPTVFLDPPYVINETLQAGSKFIVHVNVANVSDLFAWQINMSWDPSILNVSRIIAGEFLLRTTSESRTAAYQLGFVINTTDNARGYAAMSESILGGVPGESDNGTLVSIEFLVTGYGSTDLNISLTGNLATTLLDSTGGTITFTKTDGYFSNVILGDIDVDGDVDKFDFGLFAGAYGSKVGDPKFIEGADLDQDGDVDKFDFGMFAGNYGSSI